MMRTGDYPLIELTNLRKTYASGTEAETHALRDINLTIESGEFVAIMGPSGSGKSTLMHILGFLDLPTAGEYVFLGDPTTAFNEDELARIRATRVSFIFQSFNLLPRTRVYDNVMLPLLYHPTIPASERHDRTMRAIRAVGLENRADHLSNQLSGGQQQRVAIARSLVTDPEMIFADEPTGNLDSASGIMIMQTLQKLHADGHSIILVTHERTTAEHAERIIRVKDGLIESDTRDFKRQVAGERASLK